MADKQKVAVLGGGVASIVAAYELTSTPELRQRYEVTVYQLGWRLGGKCASGRNAERGSRIEEHGLHIWFGFYDNAFRIIRDLYEELGRDPDAPLATWRDAFKPCDDIVLYEHYAGRWKGWSFHVPRNPLTPGDPVALPDFWAIAHTMLEYLVQRWAALKSVNPSVAQALRPGPSRLPFGVDRLAADLVSDLLRCGGAGPEQAIVDALGLAARLQARGAGPTEADSSFLWKALDDFKHWLWKTVVRPHADDDDLRIFFTMLDVGSTLLQGIIEDRLIEQGFDSVNGEDLRAWLRRHGAQPITVGEGPFVQALYDMAFAYEHGDISRPNMAAGTAIQDLLRLMFTYRGAVCFKMQAGMGDTVFTPFYEVLKRRGVQFKFFHWVSGLSLDADKRFIEEIEVVSQVELTGSDYDPLVTVKELACWPNEPCWEQIKDGEKIRAQGVNLEWQVNPLARAPQTLRRGHDFDLVVLGISVAALSDICQELIQDAGNPRFRAMIENSHTVMTQAFQLWLARPLHRLGWPFDENSIMTAYTEPLDTYADMTQLLARECWKPEDEVHDIAYFCGVLKDAAVDETQEQADARVRDQALGYLGGDVERIWPDSMNRSGTDFDWRNLFDPDRGRGPARFDTQFWRANLQPTERYVLTPAGSVQYRLQADQSGYDNLTLTGDWTKTGLDGGCVEAAVMAGMQASRAICGVPGAIVGEDQTWLAGPTGQPAWGPPSPTAQLPPYVEYGGLATCPSPVTCQDATLYSFFLAADFDLLTELCQNVFSGPSGGQIELYPLTRYVMLSFGIVQRIRPQLAPWSRMGYATESQVAVWIPVLARRHSSSGGAVDSIGFFVPYMWVDNPLSLSGGREIYGYAKNWGWIGLPTSGPVQTLTLDAYGGNYGSGQPAGQHRLIEVTATGSSAAGGARASEARDAPAPGASAALREVHWDNLDDAVNYTQDLLTRRAPGLLALPGLSGQPELRLPDALFAQIKLSGGPPNFFLKQFRDVADGRRARAQQITRAGVTVNRISAKPLLGDFAVRLQQLDSHPLTSELGLQDQVVPGGLEIKMDFVLDDGDVLWQARAL